VVSRAQETRFELKRDRMLRAAALCFNRKGFSGTSLKDIARHLGLTDAALYYYVRNKEELVYQCYLRAADVGRAAMDRAISEGSDGFDKVRRYLAYHVESMVGDDGPVAIMSEIPSLDAAHRDQVLELSRRHSERFEQLLDKRTVLLDEPLKTLGVGNVAIKLHSDVEVEVEVRVEREEG